MLLAPDSQKLCFLLQIHGICSRAPGPNILVKSGPSLLRSVCVPKSVTGGQRLGERKWVGVQVMGIHSDNIPRWGTYIVL